MENGDVIIRSENENALQRWWKNRSRTQRKGSYCFLSIIIGLVCLFSIYFFLLSERPVTCTTPDCHATTLEILSYIDLTQNPCDDFYQFACGRFLENITSNDPFSMQSVKILMEESIQSDLNIMLKEPIDSMDLLSYNLAKKFYQACMNEEAIEKAGLKKLQYLFRQMGGWPILEGEHWKRDRFDWRTAIRNLRAFGVNSDFFFNVSIDIDKENPEKYILGIHGKFFSQSEISPNSKVAFLDYMVEVASQFEVKSVNVRKEQNDVLEFLLSLAKISEKSKTANTTYLYNLYTLPELQREFPTIPWYQYLVGILKNTATLNFDDIVSVSEPFYFKELEKLLLKTDKRLSAAINLAYIERHFDEETRANATDLIRNVKSQFKQNVLMVDWLDAETKRKVISALLSSVEKIFSGNDLIEITAESVIYDDVEIKDDDLLKAVLDLDLILWDQYYSSLRQPVKDDWIKSQTFISGLKVEYSANENKLKIPLGLFRGIYYNQNRPQYINYGLLGSVLAHQISHIFIEAKEINNGELRAAEDKLIHWWSPSSIQKYLEKLQCLSSQYGKFTLEGLDDIHTNSLITRDEDVADLAGLKVAYDSYVEREWRKGPDPLLPGLEYSARQLFWISSALQFCSKYPMEYLRDKYSMNKYQHSPNQFRVNGPLQNLDAFSNDFGCDKGSYMNPDNKCYIW